ncbi:MAG: aminoglycoside phosphotransferase family protein [Victivallales bacterium]|nr:aminoglycoside phosphotransferase family protein [Victivallales bacterium]
MQAAFMAQRFQVAGRLVTVDAIGGGNVNETYQAIFRTVYSEERFFLQRISPNVFSEPEHVMENMLYVTSFAHQRLEEEASFSDRIWQLPRIIPAKDGKYYTVDGDGYYWRAITAIASASSYNSIQSPEHAYEIGAVLGHFHRIFSELDVSRLYDTLPGFHITPQYLEQLDQVLQTSDAKARLDSSAVAGNVLKFIDRHRDSISVLEDAKARGELILRPIHGDPKTANIMIDDATGKGTCIIDLDTVKPGLIQYDLGDCLRSCCNPAGEDTTDLTSVFFNSDLCEAVLMGYKEHSRNFLTDADKEYLYDAIRLITLELAIRFFTDYLAGDIYFKIHHSGQNLERARVQVKLCQSIEARRSQIKRIAEAL